MNEFTHRLLLADDDIDDCVFFKDALDGLPVSATLITVNDGVKLMTLLTSLADKLPDMLFMDLNMPRKTGYECLLEIKMNSHLKHLPVIIFSTSFNSEVIDLLYEKGAHYYIRKPGEFAKLKKVIYKALTVVARESAKRPAKEKFLLQP